MPSINPVGPDFGFSFLMNFLGRGEATRGGGLVGIGAGEVTSSAMGGVDSGGAVGVWLCVELDGSEFTLDTLEPFGNNKTGVPDPDWAGFAITVAEAVCVRFLNWGLF